MLPEPSDASVPEMYRSDGRRRCKANRSGGQGQCNAVAMQAQDVCYTHGGATTQARSKAQERINAAADSAAAHLIAWLHDKKVPYNIRLSAAKDLLDRAQIGTDKTLTVEVLPFMDDLFDGLLVDVPETIQGEVVKAKPLPAPQPTRPRRRR